MRHGRSVTKKSDPQVPMGFLSFNRFNTSLQMSRRLSRTARTSFWAPFSHLEWILPTSKIAPLSNESMLPIFTTLFLELMWPTLSRLNVGDFVGTPIQSAVLLSTTYLKSMQVALKAAKLEISSIFTALAPATFWIIFSQISFGNPPLSGNMILHFWQRSFVFLRYWRIATSVQFQAWKQ